MIELKHINKIYNGFNALNDISLTIKDGEICGIIGQSGAGKSTLVRCINMLEPPTSGDVIVNGRNMVTLSKRELRKERKKIGMIFQHFNLLMQRNVLGNVCFPMEIAGIKKNEAKKRAYELLKIVGLEDKAAAYPAQLSGGQQQRVAIARVLANNPDILLCDEATSALDPQTTKSILELLKKINREEGITIVIITHSMSVVKEICNNVAVLENGVAVEIEKTEELFKNPKTDIAKKLVYIGGEMNLSQKELDEYVG